MVVTNDSGVAERVRMLRTHGWRKKYYPELLGCNSRLDELQAAILRVKLKHLNDTNEKRRNLARWYSEQLSTLDIGVPHEAQDWRHVYHLYVVRVKDRDSVQAQLNTERIASAIYYPQPVHMSEPFKPHGCSEGDFPVAEQASRETLAIPLFPELSIEQAKRVVEALKHAVG
jgi:dTDP-4-amino-4,6-dideoxygalactose transaminase